MYRTVLWLEIFYRMDKMGGMEKKKKKGKGLLQHFSETYHSVSWLVGDPASKPCSGFYGVGRIWLSCKWEPSSSWLCSVCPSLLTSQANSWEVQGVGTDVSSQRHVPLLLGCPAAAKSLQSCPTLCDPIDGSPPGSPVPGILQARTLEWVAISFSNA